MQTHLFKIRFLFSLLILNILCLGYISAQSGNPNTERLDQINNLERDAAEAGKTWSEESITRSIRLYIAAAKQWENIDNLSKASFCLRQAAIVAINTVHKNEAVNYLYQALRLDKKSNKDKIKTLCLLSGAYLRLGDIKKSENYVDLASQLLSVIDDVEARAFVYSALAQIAAEKNDNNNAIKYYEKAFALWQKVDGTTKEQAQALLDLSFAYMEIDEPFKGLKKAEESLKKWQEIDNKRGEAMTLIAIGQLHFKMDENQVALEALKKAEAIYPPNVDLLQKAVLYTSLGAIYEAYELWELSLVYRQKAFELYRLENYLFAQLATYPSLGKASQKLGNKVIAEQYFSAGLSLSHKLKNKLFESVIYEEIGNMYFDASDEESAERFYIKALEGVKQLGYKRMEALINGNLGKISAQQGDVASAYRYFNEALMINRIIKSKFAEADILYNLAKLDESKGYTESAIKQIKDSIAITESLYSNVSNNNLSSNYFSSVYERYELYINLLMEMDKQLPGENYALEAFQISERSRARSMLETLHFSKANLANDASAETLDRENEIHQILNSKADKLTDLLSRNNQGKETDIEKLEGEISELEHELEDIKAELEQKNPLYSELKNSQKFDIKEFQNRILDDNTLFLEFSFGEDKSYLWTVERNQINYYILRSRREIEGRIQNLRSLISAREIHDGESTEDYQNRIAAAEQTYWKEAQVLSDQLFGQIGDQIRARKRLVIVADGKLHYFPVSALPLPGANDNSPLILTNEIIFEPSASVLTFIEKREKKTSASRKDLLVFSDAVFSSDDPRLGAEFQGNISFNGDALSSGTLRSIESFNKLPRLAASKEEGEAIASIIAGSTVFSGFSANRREFLKPDISDYRIIHLATHGLIDEKHPELSGLLLSRFDEKRQKIDEFVRLQDINRLNLTADLVVLSACETGIGKEMKGQGLKSLTNAFLQAGAKSVVSSLWKVDDYAALELMKNFYGSLASEQVTASEALQKAQIKMWQNPRYQSPFFWASFTVQGDYRQLPQFTGSSHYPVYLWIMPVMLLTIILLVVYQLKRKNKILAIQP